MGGGGQRGWGEGLVLEGTGWARVGCSGAGLVLRKGPACSLKGLGLWLRVNVENPGVKR